jgi:hypothetical protein
MAVVYRRLRILTPNLGAYYSVVDEEYRPHELASRWLEVRFFGRARISWPIDQCKLISWVLTALRACVCVDGTRS